MSWWFRKKSIASKFVPCVSLEELSDFVVRYLLMTIQEKNNLNIGLCGNEGLSAILEKFAYNLNRQNINYSNINFFNLIEFCTTNTKNHELPFFEFTSKCFYKKFAVKDANIFSPNPNDNSHIERELKKSQFDIVIVEVGTDGNIGFNTNQKVFKDFGAIQKVKISESTREEYKNLFDEDKSRIPLYGLCVNFNYILKAKKIIVIGYGDTKASAIAKALENKIEKEWMITNISKSNATVLYADLAACKLALK